jgi:hypothetical protein
LIVLPPVAAYAAAIARGTTADKARSAADAAVEDFDYHNGRLDH